MNGTKNSRLRMVNAILLSLISIYSIYFGVGCSIQRSLVYPGQFRTPPEGVLEANPDIHVLSVWSDGSEAEAWYLPPLDSSETEAAPYPTVVFAHGNNQVNGMCVGQVRSLREMGLGVLMPEYPGYGRSKGKPTETSITDAAIAAYDSAVAKGWMDSTRVLISGHSLGAAVACALALQRPSRAMILISAFVDMKSMVAKYFLPGFFVLDPWDNLDAVKRYTHPLMIIHGQRDKRVPYGHAVTLYENSSQSVLVTTGGDHNHPLPDWGDLWRRTRPFLYVNGILTNLPPGMPVPRRERPFEMN